MAAAMNGMALHGGVIPYGGTFLVFSDYCRPAIRLSALQQARVIYVMTHDSIGLGEDGPTHQPVEHLMSLRADPQSRRLPPCRRGRDGRMLGAGAAQRRTGRRCSRSPGRICRRCALKAPDENLCARGAYRLRAADRRAPGRAARDRLRGRAGARRRRRARGAGRSAPTSSRCPAGAASTRRTPPIAPTSCPTDALDRVSIEAGATLGWERYTGRDGLTIGLDRFGASAPAEDLFEHFGFTAEAIVPQIIAALEYIKEINDMATKVAINGFGRIGRLVARAILAQAGQRSRAGRDQRSRRRQVERAAVQARFSVHGPYPGTVTRRRQRPDHRRQAHQGHRRARSGQSAARGERHRHRARMHRLLHRSRRARRSISTPAPSGC